MGHPSNRLSLTQRIALEALWLLCRFIAILPSFVRHHILGTMVYWLLCYILRYRRRVIMENLHRSFPKKSEKELREICRKSYRNLAEQIINTISQAGASEKQLKYRMKVVNPQEVIREIGEQSVILMTAHLGSWEAGSTVSLSLLDHTFVAVYHELGNRIFDELLKRIRQHRNVELVSMKRLMRHFIDHRHERPMALGLISDQNPVIRPNFHWYAFLNQWTAFYNGAELLSTKYHLPVYYFSPRRIKAGVYEGRFIKIHDGKEPIEEFVITERYARLLEADINAAPELWMWSHRRWKHTPPPEILAQRI